MIKSGGLEYFEEKSKRQSNVLYDFIDNNSSQVNCKVEKTYRSNSNVVFNFTNEADTKNFIKLSTEKDDEQINELSKKISQLGGKPNLDETDKKVLIKNLNKQLETLSVNSILQDQSKNKVNDLDVNGVKVRFQNVEDLPPKELRKLVDKGKKELGEGIVIVFASKDDKVGIAVGVTEKLIDKFDAVQFVKAGSEVIGGKGGGGRKDFAQAGGQDQSKINDAFEKIKALI